jgi:nucleoside-diphosphate-sugar epimerase
VKDVRLAHYRAIARPEAANKRFLLSQDYAVWGEEFNAILKTELDKQGIPNNIQPLTYEEPTPTKVKVSNARSREILGIEYARTFTEILVASATDMLKYNLV